MRSVIMANKDDLWENTEPIEELRRGDWGFAPEILAAGMDLPRRTDGSEYEAAMRGHEIKPNSSGPVYVDPMAATGDLPRREDRRPGGHDA
ncbi:hypothetical protein ACQFYA_20875 [Promicromonospora sp. Marseille-Q5078]